jgi:hypothetical protein
MSKRRGVDHAQKQHEVMQDHARPADISRRSSRRGHHSGRSKKARKSKVRDLRNLSAGLIKPPKGRWLKLDDNIIK